MTLINQLEEVEGRVTIFNFLPYILFVIIVGASIFLKKIYFTKQSKVLLFFGIYVLISNLIINQAGEMPLVKFLVNTIQLLMPCYLLFYLSNSILNKNIDVIVLKKIILIAFYTFVITYFYFVYINFGVSILNEFTAFNSAYYLIFFLPIILYLYKNKRIKNSALIIVFIAILLSFKRGGILAIILGYLGYYYTNALILTKIRALAIFKLIITFVTIIIGLLIVNSYVDDYIFERFSSIQEDKGSARTEIIEEVLDGYSQSNIFQLIFGRGGEATMKLNSHELSAHNDFIEILVNHGYLGLLILLVFIFSQISLIKKEFLKKNSDISSFVFIFIVLLLLAQVSHVIIYPLFTIYILMQALIISNFNKINK